MNANIGEINRATKPRTKSIWKSPPGSKYSKRSVTKEMIGAVKRIINTNMPAQKTKPISINLSLRKGLGRVTPQAVLIPLLIAPKAADEAHINPRKLAIPVMVRAFTIPSMVEPIKSLETGRTSAIWIANSVLSLSGPMMNAITDTTAKPSGNNENNA